MSKKLKSINDIIQSERAFDKFRKAAKQQDVIEKFDEIFPDMKKIARPKWLDKKTLIVKVENSVWRSELNLKKDNLAVKINEYFKEDLIKTIKFI